MGCPDNYSKWEKHERQAEAWLAKRPVCCYCDEPIQDDFCYEINGELICDDCLDTCFRRAVDDCI